MLGRTPAAKLVKADPEDSNTLTVEEQARLRGMLRSMSVPELAKSIGVAETTLMRAMAYPPLPLHGITASKIRQKLPSGG